LQEQLKKIPRLTTWVVRTRDVASTFLGSEVPLGAIKPMTRGNLRWLITFANDGTLPEEGMMPTLIRWLDGPHPASKMKDLGCSLERFEAVHSESVRYARILKSIGADQYIDIRQAAPGFDRTCQCKFARRMASSRSRRKQWTANARYPSCGIAPKRELSSKALCRSPRFTPAVRPSLFGWTAGIDG
jgi:hypothetical protein